MRTIGVSVPVPEPWGSEIQRRRCEYGDTAATGIPTHVTILPPTEVEDADLPGILAHLREAASRVESFEMVLRGTGTFRPVSPVVFVQVAQGIASCEQLERQVRTGPLTRDLNFPYHPHVTLVFGVGDDVLDRAFEELGDFCCSFPVTEVVQYEEHDGVWHEQESFPLATSGSD